VEALDFQQVQATDLFSQVTADLNLLSQRVVVRTGCLWLFGASAQCARTDATVAPACVGTATGTVLRSPPFGLSGQFRQQL
jgi:hypothetical protein